MSTQASPGKAGPLQLLLAQQPGARHADGRVQPVAPRDAALLAWLALEGSTPRDRLALLLWPGSTPEAARNALRQRLFQLKKQFGDALLAGQAQLQLATGVSHDLTDADDVLGGVRLDIGGEFAAWLQHQRARRRSRTWQALAELADMAEAVHDWGDALAHARELLALQPLSEDAHRRVMRLHYLVGDRAAALLAFDTCEAVLKDEVGTRPGAETLALLRTIESAQRPASRAGGVPAAVLRPPRLVGREHERALLQRARDDATSVLLRGEGGMGKSRLLAEAFGDAGAAGAPVDLCRVGARPGDAPVPHALTVRWLRSVAAGFDLQLAKDHRATLARWLPEWGQVGPQADSRHALVDACEAVLDAAVARGLRAVVVDDLHFADSASLQLLQALVGRVPVGWVLAFRPAELGDAAQALVDSHLSLSGTLDLQLQPLDVAAVEALLETLGLDGIGGEQQAAALHARTGGNPLYLLETLKAVLVGPRQALVVAGGAPVPVWPAAASVTRLIQHRLSRLSTAARELARCAAVAGSDLSPALAAHVLGRRPLELVEAWAELDAAQVLRDGAFAHDLIAEAAQASLPAAIARHLHGEVAQWLQDHAGDPGHVSQHWLAAGESLKAVPHLRAAALRAQAAWQSEEAVKLCSQAGDILLAAGRRSEAFDAYLKAAELLAPVRVDAQLEALTEVLDSLADDDARRAAAACARIALLGYRRRLDEARSLTLDALVLARRAGAGDLEVELLWNLTVFDWERRELRQAQQHAEVALRRLEGVDLDTSRIDLHETRFKLLHAVGTIQVATGQYAAGDAQLEAALRTATGQRVGIAHMLAASALEQGDGRRARAWVNTALDTDDHDRAYPNTRVSALAVCGDVLASCGDLGAALAALQRAAALCAEGSVRNGVAALLRQGVLLHGLGRRDLALKVWKEQLQRDDLTPTERLRAQALAVGVGEALDSRAVLDGISAIDDLPLRSHLLASARPGCPPADVLLLLNTTAASARDCGAHGLWLTLQAHRSAALRQAGRADEARQAALQAWQRAEDGVTATEPFAQVGALLCRATLPFDTALAETMALQVLAWMHRAAATLPAEWRENYLSRAPAAQALAYRPVSIGRA